MWFIGHAHMHYNKSKHNYIRLIVTYIMECRYSDGDRVRGVVITSSERGPQ